MNKTYYQILGVTPTMETDEIKQAYRKLAKENHPDLHSGDKAAEERFKDIGVAWDTLGDETKRKAYDKKLSNERVKPSKQTSASKTAPKGNVDIEKMMKGFGTMFSEEHFQQNAKSDAKKGPINSDDLFARFMGYKK